MAKYGMSMCVLGMAEEFKSKGVSVNALWPKTAIHTAAIEMLTGPDSNQFSRKPEIMADAAYEILSKDPRSAKTGQFYIDEEVLRSAGISDMKQYACVPENADNLMPDFFLDALPEHVAKFVPASAQSSSAGSGKIEGLFSKIEQQLNEDLVKRVNAVYAFDVKGEEAGLWYLDLKNGSGKCGKGDSPTPADATLIMDSKNFFAMFSGNLNLEICRFCCTKNCKRLFPGKLNAATAFMSGKLKISGDLQKAMKLEKLMGSLKSKL